MSIEGVEQCPYCGAKEPSIKWISGEYVAECCEQLSLMAEDILPDELLVISYSRAEAINVWRTLAACAGIE